MPKVPERASGMVMLEINVGQKRRRKRNITITTNAMVIRRVICTSLTDARIVLVRSAITLRRTLGGSQVRNCGSRA